MKYYLLFSVTAFLAIALSCAKQTSPTGGPKDTIPPTLVNTIPPNKSIKFTGKTIELVFDEHIQIDNAREQLLITPTIDQEKIELTAQKNKATLRINTPLPDSTTYTFNFRESIKDITERTPAKNLQIALSTGPYIDSLTIKGNVFYQLKSTSAEDATIALILPSDTFDIFKHKPTYLTKSDKEGNFTFENLKPNEYFLYAYNDKNKNLIVDSRSEPYGFKAEHIKLTPDSLPSITIPIGTLDARPLKLISARPYNTYYNIRFSKFIKQYSLSQLATSTQKLHHLKAEDNSNVRVYFKDPINDSLAVKLFAVDSIGNQIDTLLYVKSNPIKSTPEKFTITKVKTSLTLSPNLLTASIRFNKPIQEITYDSIFFIADSTNIFKLDNTLTKLDTQQNILIFKKEIPKEFLLQKNKESQDRAQTNTDSPKPINKLYFKKGALISIENDSSQLIQEEVQPITELNSGIIQVEIKSESNFNPIIEILDTQYKTVQSKTNTWEATFTNLTPGDYIIKLIIDLNNNNQWDPGNFYTLTEPEPILFFRGENDKLNVTIKANWEVGPLLITYP